MTKTLETAGKILEKEENLLMRIAGNPATALLLLVLTPLIMIQITEITGMFTLEGHEIFTGAMLFLFMLSGMLVCLFTLVSCLQEGNSLVMVPLAIAGVLLTGYFCIHTATGTLELISLLPPGVSILADELGPKLIVP